MGTADEIQSKEAAMKYSMLIATMLCMWITTSHAEMGFDQRYERDYNIFNPATGAIPETAKGVLRWRRSRYCSTEPAVHTKCGMDAPLNPANAYDLNSAFNPANRYDPGNPANPANQYSPNNPFNPANRYHPDNPLNPVNKFNPAVPFGPLDKKARPDK